MAFQEVEMDGGRRNRNGDNETVNPVHATVAEQTLAEITKLRAAVVDMKALQAKLGTPKDTTTLRSRLKQRRAEAKAADKAIRGLVVKLKKSRTSKSKIQRILKDLVNVADAYKKVAKETELKERQFLAQASARQLNVDASQVEEGKADRGRRRDDAGDLATGLQGVNFQILTDVDLHIMREREEEAEAIAREAVGLQDVTQDLAILVDQQGASINEMEKNVDSAKKNVEDGIEHLEVATDRQKAYRKKLWCVLGCGILIVVAILVPTLIKLT